MKKLLLAEVSLLAIVLLVLGSQTNVVGYQTVQASTANEYVEFETSVYGMPGQKSGTVRLTSRQAEEVDGILEQTNAKMANASSRDEALSIFKEAVTKLHPYGLLNGLNVEQAQRLFNERHLPSSFLTDERADVGYANLFCLVSASYTANFYGSPTFIFTLGMFQMACTFLYTLIQHLGNDQLSRLFRDLGLYAMFSLPVRFMSICFCLIPAIHSIGLKGIVDIPYGAVLLGFSGLTIQNFNSGKGALLGFSLALWSPN